MDRSQPEVSSTSIFVSPFIILNIAILGKDCAITYFKKIE